MRISIAFLFSVTLSIPPTFAFSQSPCSSVPKSGDQFLTFEQIAHRAMLTTSPENRRHLIVSDVEFILRCGTQQDAETLFAAVVNTPVRLIGVTVVEANQSSIRIALDDSPRPVVGTFLFNFDKPLSAMPRLGERVSIVGIYASYTREPFRIFLTKSSF